LATIRYAADGTISPERFIAALTDFSEGRPEQWPNLDARFYRLHELGDTWAEVTEGTDVFAGCGRASDMTGPSLGVVLRVIGSRRFANDPGDGPRAAGRDAGVIRRAPDRTTNGTVPKPPPRVPLARCPSSPSTA
jgi:hypothetical protein